MIFYENRLLADVSHVISYFCQKLGKMSQNLSSAAVVIGALKVKPLFSKNFQEYHQNVKLFGSRSGLMCHWSWSGSKPFANVISKEIYVIDRIRNL